MRIHGYARVYWDQKHSFQWSLFVFDELRKAEEIYQKPKLDQDGLMGIIPLDLEVPDR